MAMCEWLLDNMKAKDLNAFSSKPDSEGQLPNCINPDISNVGASDVILQDSDVVMEDITKGYPHIPGIYLHQFCLLTHQYSWIARRTSTSIAAHISTKEIQRYSA
jgi:hypothetical protein